MEYEQIGDSKYKVISLLGSGSFGKVILTEKNGKKYALKIIDNVGKEGIKSLREIDIMSRISHPNLMKADYIETSFEKDISKIGIFMDVADGDLNKAMRDNKFSITDRYSVLRQITLGLKALHDSGYLHLDLKPLNVLLFKNIAKISDFGLSLITENHNKYFPLELCTIDFRSINILNGSKIYTSADDVWSLGMIFLAVLSGGKSLFVGFTSKDYTENKVKKIYQEKLSDNNIDITLNNMLVDKKALPIIKKMLNFDATKRATLSEVINFFNVKKIAAVYSNPFINTSICDIAVYKGYDALFRMAMKIDIRLETFFLAVDYYHRSLQYRNISSNIEENQRNAVYQASLSLYMAIKMIESYYADAKMFANLAENIFKPEKLLLGEAALVNNWTGVLYPNNLFRASTTERRILEALELSHNCFLYPKINLTKWREYSEEEEKIEGKFNKYILFKNIVGKTKYYHVMLKGEDYIQEFYQKESM